MLQVGLLSAFMKCFQVLFLLFLPILYYEKLINEIQLWYLWSLLLTWVLAWSFLSAKYLQHYSAKHNLLISVSSFIVGSIALLFQSDVITIIAYSIIGLGTGIGMSAVSKIQYAFSESSDRFTKLANISMMGDVMRITFPFIVGLIYKFFWLGTLQFFTLFIGILLLAFIRHSKHLKTLAGKDAEVVSKLPLRQFTKNKGFVFGLFMDFLDWFSSSQLFIFLPLLLTYKWIIFENAVLLQSIIFIWYLCGRRLMARIAQLSNGYISVAAAEIGMALCIIWLLFLNSITLIVILCFLLGICTRWTSPVIKWIVFDHLKPQESASWSAIFIFVWSVADILGQLAFWVLFASVGIYGPFGLAWTVAILLAIACLIKVMQNKNALIHRK